MSLEFDQPSILGKIERKQEIRTEQYPQWMHMSISTYLVSYIVGEPVQSLIQPFPGGGTCTLDIPVKGTRMTTFYQKIFFPVQNTQIP